MVKIQMEELVDVENPRHPSGVNPSQIGVLLASSRIGEETTQMTGDYPGLLHQRILGGITEMQLRRQEQQS
jgi:hypothetical protein